MEMVRTRSSITQVVQQVAPPGGIVTMTDRGEVPRHFLRRHRPATIKQAIQRKFVRLEHHVLAMRVANAIARRCTTLFASMPIQKK